MNKNEKQEIIKKLVILENSYKWENTNNQTTTELAIYRGGINEIQKKTNSD